jgi:hypothetical protein
MKFHNAVTKYLDSFPSADLRPVETAGGETWEEDSATVFSLDLGSESTPDLHGSFEWLLGAMASSGLCVTVWHFIVSLLVVLWGGDRSV